MTRRAGLLIGLLVVIFGATAALGGAPAVRRRPVALATADGGRWLFAANSGGSVSVVDTAARAVVGEHVVGASLADLAPTPDGRRLLAVDEAGGRLVVLDRDGPRLTVAVRVGVAPGPVVVAVSPDGTRCAVASKWARRITLVELGAVPRAVGGVNLPFPPRRMVVAPPEKLIVADAFGGGLAVVDLKRGEVDSVRTLPAHNIGGLALSADGERLLLTQQYLNARADTKADDIHWGFLMTNSVRSLRLAAVLDPRTDVVPGGRLDHLGEPGRGAGDPAGLAALPGGSVLVALAGVGELAVGPLARPDERRIAVGPRPTAVAISPDARLAYVADALDGAVTVVDLAAGRRVATVALGPRPAETEVDRGERLFHDARLSHEGWMSCRSCHADGHASALLADTLGDGSYGAPKRTLSLLGVGDTAPYGWDGKVATLEEQVKTSFRTTLQGKARDEADARAVAAYLRTLAPPPATTPPDPAAAARGLAVFERRRCDRCHAPPAYTSPKSYDVGLADDVGNALFNPPSLRGVAHRDRLFHDGRARGLGEVFTRFGHPGGRDWDGDEVSDLIAFLRSL